MGTNVRPLSVPGAPLSAPSMLADVQRWLPVGRGNERDGLVRERLHDTLAGRSRPMREYLTRNVLDEHLAEIRHFIIDTSVLDRRPLTELGRLDAGVLESWAEAGLTLAVVRREGRRWSGR